jgi:hypothetical protein
LSCCLLSLATNANAVVRDDDDDDDDDDTLVGLCCLMSIIDDPCSATVALQFAAAAVRSCISEKKEKRPWSALLSYERTGATAKI